MLAKFFKDLDKTAEKVLDRDAGWNFDRKLKIKTKTENGVTYTSESTLSSQKGKGVTSKLSAGYKHSSVKKKRKRKKKGALMGNIQ